MSWFSRKKEPEKAAKETPGEVAARALKFLDDMEGMAAEPNAVGAMSDVLTTMGKLVRGGYGPEFQRDVLKIVKSRSVKKAETLERLWNVPDWSFCMTKREVPDGLVR